MSTPNEDLAVLLTRLESWTTRVPREFEAFHRQREELLKRIRDLSRAFQRRDPAEAASVIRRFLSLEGDLPVLEQLAGALAQARAEVTQLSAAPAPDPQIRSVVEDWCQYWLSLLDAIPASAADRNAALPFLSQVQLIENWASTRRRALAILTEAAALRDRATAADRKQEIEKELASWREAFIAERTNDAWLAAAEKSLEGFKSRAVEKPASPPATEVPAKPPAEPLVSKAAPVSKAASPTIATPSSNAAPPPPSSPNVAVASNGGPSGAPLSSSANSEALLPSSAAPSNTPRQPVVEESPQLLSWRIDQLLAECRDLVEALDYQGSELEAFDSRQWQLGNQPDPPVDGLRALCAEIDAFRNSLLEQAGKECDQRFERLQLRWQWFQAVYGARPEIEDLIQQAQTGHPAGTHHLADGARRLKEFLRKLNSAEQLIYANVDADRSKLAEFVKRSADQCRAVVKELRGQARLASVDAALVVIERQIPESPGSQLDAVDSFALLDKCHRLERELQTRGEENRRRQQEALDKAANLRRLASLIGGTQAGAIAGEIPQALPLDRSLDQTAAELSKLEALLEAERTRVRNAMVADLTRLRKENVAWSRLLADFTTEAQAFVTTGAPPQELDELRMAVEREQEYRRRIADLTARASRQLVERREQAREWLRQHLAAPAFPARKTAEENLAALDELPAIEETPRRDDFSIAFDAVSNAEAFIDSIEAERRALPDKIRDLEREFEQLVDDWGARSYRPELFRRAAAMLAGMQKALERELWQPLDYQLGQTRTLIASLRADALLQIGNEVEQLVEQLRAAIKNSRGDTDYVLKIETALRQLEDEGQLDPPSGAIRSRLRNLRDRRAGSAREARAL